MRSCRWAFMQSIHWGITYGSWKAVEQGSTLMGLSTGGEMHYVFVKSSGSRGLGIRLGTRIKRCSHHVSCSQMQSCLNLLVCMGQSHGRNCIVPWPTSSGLWMMLTVLAAHSTSLFPSSLQPVYFSPFSLPPSSTSVAGLAIISPLGSCLVLVKAWDGPVQFFRCHTHSVTPCSQAGLSDGR